MTIEIGVRQMQGRVPVTVLEPRGDVDASNYVELIAAAQQAYVDGVRDLLLDLGSVPFLSSSGVVALASIAALMRGDEAPDLQSGWGAFRALDHERESGCQEHFKLVHPQPHVERVLETIGMMQFLDVYSDLDEAVASF